MLEKYNESIAIEINCTFYFYLRIVINITRAYTVNVN